MIVRAAGDDTLMDIQAAHALCGRRPVRTIRKHCEPSACDLRTRVLLYSEADLLRTIMSVQRRHRVAV